MCETNGVKVKLLFSRVSGFDAAGQSSLPGANFG